MLHGLSYTNKKADQLGLLDFTTMSLPTLLVSLVSALAPRAPRGTVLVLGIPGTDESNVTYNHAKTIWVQELAFTDWVSARQ